MNEILNEVLGKSAIKKGGHFSRGRPFKLQKNPIYILIPDFWYYFLPMLLSTECHKIQYAVITDQVKNMGQPGCSLEAFLWCLCRMHFFDNEFSPSYQFYG